MNPVTLRNMTARELLALAADSPDPLARALSGALAHVPALEECAAVLECHGLDPEDPKGLDRELERLYDAAGALEERDAELAAARADLEQAEADRRELQAELDAANA